MNEKIPQHVILDLLPLYLAEEISEETRSLIEEYLKTDPQLAKLAEQANNAKSLQEIPAPINKETEMESLKKVKKTLAVRNIYMALALLFTFNTGFLVMLDLEPLVIYMLVWMSGLLWFGFYRANKKISD